MTKKERFYETIARRKVDKPCWWLGLPTEAALPNLYKHFMVNNFHDFKLAVDDDIWTFDMPYNNGTTNAISMAFDFAKKDLNLKYNERTLTSAGFFEDYEEECAVELFDWPDPSKFITKEACDRLINEVPSDYPIMPILWSAHFQDACAAFGMQDALIKMKIAPMLFKAVINKIIDFYLKANGIFYEYTRNKIDAVLIGNDFGTQTSLIVGSADLQEFIFDGTKRLIEQAHSYGLKVIHHSCGAISSIMPDLIKCGADVIHPIQALAVGMEPLNLKEKFGNEVSFAGGIDAQNLLVKGSPQQVIDKVIELRSIFPTGLIISPSHEAILPDISILNIEAIVKAMKK